MNYKFPLPVNVKFSQIKIGSEYSFNKIFSNSDILSFAKLTGDFNPLHINPNHGQKIFRQNIIHGMLTASLFSTLVGMYYPGKNCLYLSQETEFIRPIYPNQEMTVKGTIISKVEALKLINIKTEILLKGEVVIKGLAKVKVLEQ
ncbi:hypothetical protein A3I48_01100 [Candidatus Daviesbacteria bacterium RIFCSPLOWO2_02_FULL_36_7]|uniref:MaoC-like domain-containing protein n=1 Tax=Candidatus Daviesbacteria bacterium RIFCSPLOWO2_02_FULL_36_7 TaxID=1797792 RepID=A0A1F5MHH3_9BACT|nr:MAG: hypothetical protein A3I48_01100 [Candidatus Daviesbacteria bacterium RIFCSPLOWO2_02_FULL_36_7]